MKIRSFITLNSSQIALQYLCLVYITCNIILTEQIPHYIDNNNIDRNNECMIFFNLQKVNFKKSGFMYINSENVHGYKKNCITEEIE